jgi:prepilin signal peptidase PulO-like enzyme (type II secretory pathway)
MNAGEPDVYQWWKWVPGDDMKFKHGQGYWINMKAAATLTFVGSFKTTGPAAPPEYPVFEGWNLIGYTHWGQPTSHWIGDKRVVDYLGVPLTPSVEALWRYDAVSETYVPMYFMDYMVKGFGYWLGLAQGGTINP